MCQVPPYHSIKINPGARQVIAGADTPFTAIGDGELDGPIKDAVASLHGSDGVDPLMGLSDPRLATCLSSGKLDALQTAGPFQFFYQDGDTRYAEANFKGGVYQSLSINWKAGTVALASALNGPPRNGICSQDLPGTFAMQSAKVVITPGVEEIVPLAASPA